MRVHHLNCGSWSPRGGRLVNGGGKVPARMVCHCLLLEAGGELVLVDSGFGLGDTENPDRLSRPLRALGRPALDPEETAVRQVQGLGFAPDDVRHVVLTHLDLDHAGGIPDFPKATVHVLAAEHEAALAPSTRLERMRYQPAHWSHAPRWALYAPQGEPWFGFESVRELRELTDDILLVPLAGHTRGHAAVAVRTEAGWVLHAGDLYFHHAQMDPVKPSCTLGLSMFQRIAQIDGPLLRRNRERVRQLALRHGDEVRVMSAHDPVEFDAAARASASG